MSFSNSGPGWNDHAERWEQAMRGNRSALYEEQKREEERQRDKNLPAGPSLSPSIPIWPMLALILVIGLVAALLAGLILGVEWLATSSPIAPLFAAPGDGIVRYLVGTAALLALVPGLLLAVASSLRNGRLRKIAAPLAVVAVLLVPILLWATQLTSMATVGRI